MISKLVEKLKDPEYRKGFVASQINVGIPFQIRALLKSRLGWTQETLAEKAGMLQPRISGLMTPGKVRPNIETLRRIAEAFDCGLIVRFAPFSELARWSENFDPEEFSVPSFDHDTGFIEHKGPMSASAFGSAIVQATGTETGSLPQLELAGFGQLPGHVANIAKTNVRPFRALDASLAESPSKDSGQLTQELAGSLKQMQIISQSGGNEIGR
jgi:transcriptional regulator with XRE-family HTH domain